MKKRLKACVPAMMAAMMMTAGMTGSAFAAEDGTHLNVAMFMWMDGLDPAEGWNGWTTMRCGIGETLLTADENMDVVPCLADSWEQVDDTTYKFHIRQGVKFSNGNDMTPETVKESIERTAAQNSRGENLKLASVEVDGENVIFKTTEPYSAFPYYLTEPMCIIVDTTVDTSNYDNAPVCTGPFVCEEYVPEEKYELKANEYYWDGTPGVDSVTVLNIDDDTKVSAMLSGDIDVAVAPSSTTLSQIEGSDNIEMVKVTGTRENDLEMNCREDRPTADVNLRKALSYAIDRDVIAQVAGNGYAQALGKAFPDTVGYDEGKDVESQTYDLDKAKEYLAEAGYEDTDGNGYVERDGEELELHIALRSNASTAVYQAMQDMWKTAGIHVEIDLMENTSDARDSGDFDFIGGGWQTVNNADGQSYLKNRWSDGGPDNYTAFHSDAFQEVMERLDTAFDYEDRVQCFVDAENVLTEECPTLFLYANENITLINTDKVKDVTVFPIDYYMLTSKWTAAE